MTHGEHIYQWIHDRLKEGRTVYISTAWHAWKIDKRHADLITMTADREHCLVQHDRMKDSINGCDIRAR